MPYCPSCGSSIESEHRYCGSCGYQLQDSLMEHDFGPSSKGFLSSESKVVLHAALNDDSKSEEEVRQAASQIEEDVREMLFDFALLGKAAGPFSFGSLLEELDSDPESLGDMDPEDVVVLKGIAYLVAFLQTSSSESLDELAEIAEPLWAGRDE